MVGEVTGREESEEPTEEELGWRLTTSRSPPGQERRQLIKIEETHSLRRVGQGTELVVYNY